MSTTSATSSTTSSATSRATRAQLRAKEREGSAYPPDALSSGSEIEIRSVTKRYGSFTALDAVDLRVPAGSFTVLLGPSGSGKSTLLRALAGIERIDAGSVSIRGRVVSDASRTVAPEKRGLGMVFQDYALWPHLSVADNVGFSLRRKGAGTGSRAGDARAVATMLDRVGLGQLGSRYPNELSGGQQQRVALARAMVAAPSLVLFDEPLSNLDADLRERLRLEIATVTREVGATAVYITHDQGEAFALADTVAVLDSGRLVQVGPPEDIYVRPSTPFVARFTGLAGTIPGRVVHPALDDGGIGDVETPGGLLRVRVAPGVCAGERVTVFVRPGATRFAGPSVAPHPDEVELPGIAGPGTTGGAREAAGGRAAENVVAGQVLDVAYRGRAYDHVVAGAFGTLSAVSSSRGLRRGEQCAVTIRPHGAIAFRESDDTDARH